MQYEHLCFKVYHFFFFFRKWQIISQEKTLISQLGSCRVLWSCIETAIWTSIHWLPLNSTIWRKILECIPHFFLTEERKTWTFWMTRGWVNLWTFLFWKWNNPLKRAELLAAIVFWAANRNTAPLRYGRHKFESRLKDLSQSQPPSLSHFASCQLWSVLS